MSYSKIKHVGMAFLRNERGATAIEYGLIASGLVMLIILSIRSVSGEVAGTFQATASELKANNTP